MDAKKRSDLIDKIEEIQNKNYNQFKGVNEADLATREEIADLFEQLMNEASLCTCKNRNLINLLL
ncbi:MAG: hypothetical protein WC389_22040 [Lutibacter sp.]|jgi:hypothetical protein